jgi:hypothetical protein
MRQTHSANQMRRPRRCAPHQEKPPLACRAHGSPPSLAASWTRFVMLGALNLPELYAMDLA